MAWARFCGFVLVALLAMTTAAHAQRWIRAESAGFIVYGANSEQRVYAAAEELEAFDALLRRITQAPAERSPTKLEIYLLNSDRFHEVWPGVSDTVRGFYAARIDQIGAFSMSGDGYGLDARDVLYHEYAHHFMFQHFANAYPAWYIEGFAEFVSTANIGTERIVLGYSSESRFYTLRNEIWLPMERLITARPSELTGDDIFKFYAQSWLFAHYLTLTPGRMAQFQAYVRAQRLGAEPAAAFETGFGMTPDQMQGELRRYLRGDPNALALTRPAAVERSSIQISRLPASADQLLTINARVRRGVSEANAAETIARFRSLAASAPPDRFSTLSLAFAETTIGERGNARALLEPWLAAHPEDFEALYVLGLGYLRDAQDTEGEARTQAMSLARRNLTRAHNLNQNHFPTLYRYAETFVGQRIDEATAQNRLNTLLLAQQLAPQIDEIAFSTSYALMDHNRHAEAIPLLRAMAYDPHGGSSAERARELLGEAEEAVRGGAPTP